MVTGSASLVMSLAMSLATTIATLVVGPITPPQDALDLAEHLVFAVDLRTFLALADSPSHDPRLDWSSDGCSAPVVESTGRSFDFTGPCRRHDFGYRNLSALETGRRWTATMRARVDAVFRRDMRAHCATRSRVVRLSCRSWAEIFYRVVRARGGP